MPRNKNATVEKDDDERGPATDFLDGLPGSNVDPDPDDDDDDTPPDDDDDDDGDDDGSGEGEPVPMPLAASAPAPRQRPPPKPRSTIRGPRGMTPEQASRSPALRAARDFQESAYQEIDSLLAGLNFATREYEIRVERLEPDFDENDVPCSGNLATYRDKVSVDDIRRRYGGGTFNFKIFGPHPSTGRPGIIKQEKFKIGGPPKPMKSHKAANGAGEPMTEVLRTIAETNERSQQRVVDLLERTRDSSSSIEAIIPTVMPLIERFFSKSEDAAKATLEAQRLEFQRAEVARKEERETERQRREDQRREDDKKEAARLEVLREEREAAREAAREEREARAEAAKEAREEARALREQAKRDEDKKEAERREARSEERERAKEERERLREEMKNDAAEKQRQHERDIVVQQERSKEAADRQREHMTMMQNFQQSQMEMLERRQENGGLESVVKQMMMLKDLRGELTGDNDEPSNFEKFTEGLQTIAGTVMPVATQFMNARGGKPAQLAAPVRQPIAVDLGPHRPALPNPTAPAAPAAPVANPTGPDAVVTTTGEAPSVPTEEQPMQNDLTAFVFPTESDDMPTAGIMLMKNIDLAVQRNMSPEEIVQQILEPFEDAAPLMVAMASGFTSDQLMEFIENNVPAGWALLSPRGEELVVKAFDLWQEDEAA